MTKRRIPLAVILAVFLAVAATGCSTVQKPAPSASAAPSSSGAPSPSEQPNTEPSDEPEAPSPDTSADAFPSESPAGETIVHTIDPGDFFTIGDELMQKDGIGPVRLNMTEDALLQAVGEPDSKSEPELWGADGLEHSVWTYGKDGLQINMAKTPEESSSIVFTITAGAPCTLTTQRGIKIGDTKDAVLAAYADAVDPSAATDTSLVLGTVYGGMVITLEEGLVKEIFIGASAE